ncbi:hypothetical protein LSH36_482g01058 [Paralvinella palmiformis]|uniref:LRRCT domain-containing protein n=1 Tax=Paralvinella palmiformis TaxID=53620 RepID=A0AAD9MYE5_9ANNE|nr:hypothetical protein LSH36_482g01058 [Paralvinella palmiformis]
MRPYEGCMIRYGRRGCFHRILNGVLVTCDGRGKESEVPQNLPGDAVYLSLVNFRLDSLQKANFTRFKSVECLTIVDSGVRTIATDTFSLMENLHELVMENTSLHNGHLNFMAHPQFKANLVAVARSRLLRRVNISVTPNLREIKTLDLHNNSIESLDGRLFAELRNTEKLVLSHNRLKELDWAPLKEMTKLNKLFLDHNRIQTVPEIVHSIFFAVKELRMAGNPLHCNCKLRWLRDFYQTAIDKTLDFDDVNCISPHAVPMRRVPPRDFICTRPSRPIVEWIRLDSRRYEVNCTSTGDPAPTLQITLPGQRTVITPPSDELSKVSTTTPQMLCEAGSLTCVATNSEGTATVTVELPCLAWLCCSGRIPMLSLIQHSLYVGVVEKTPPPPLRGEQYGKMEPKYPEDAFRPQGA